MAVRNATPSRPQKIKWTELNSFRALANLVFNKLEAIRNSNPYHPTTETYEISMINRNSCANLRELASKPGKIWGLNARNRYPNTQQNAATNLLLIKCSSKAIQTPKSNHLTSKTPPSPTGQAITQVLPITYKPIEAETGQLWARMSIIG